MDALPLIVLYWAMGSFINYLAKPQETRAALIMTLFSVTYQCVRNMIFRQNKNSNIFGLNFFGKYKY